MRVTDLDFAYHQITVRDGKGAQDRVTMLPQTLVEPSQRYLTTVHLHRHPGSGALTPLEAIATLTRAAARHAPQRWWKANDSTLCTA